MPYVPDVFSLLNEGICRRLVISAALPDDLYFFSSGTSVGYPFLHGVVEGRAAETSSDDEDVLLLRVEAIKVESFLLHLFCCGYDLLSDRISCKDNLVGREESFHSFICHTDLSGLFSKNLVGQARKAVLLLNEGGNTQTGGCPQKGSAGISSHAYCYVRSELPDDLFSHRHALDDLEGERQI